MDEGKFEEPGSLVIVKWLDASYHGGWSDEPGLALSNIICIGFVLRHDETSLLICQAVGHDGQGVLNELAIPTAGILLIDHPRVKDISQFQTHAPQL